MSTCTLHNNKKCEYNSSSSSKYVFHPNKRISRLATRSSRRSVQQTRHRYSNGRSRCVVENPFAKRHRVHIAWAALPGAKRTSENTRGREGDIVSPPRGHNRFATQDLRTRGGVSAHHVVAASDQVIHKLGEPRRATFWRQNM